MNRVYYQSLKLPELHKLFSVAVRSQLGSNLQPVGLTTYRFVLGKNAFYEFIACKNLQRSLLLGLNFLKTHRIVKKLV